MIETAKLNEYFIPIDRRAQIKSIKF